MSLWLWLLVALGAIVAVYAGFVAGLVAVGRRTDARALAGFVPDCCVLCARLLRDPRVSRGQKALLVGLIGYLAFPLDLVPDFIPVAGQLDDVLVVGLVLRGIIRSGGEKLVREHWPGPERSVDLVLRLTGASKASEAAAARAVGCRTPRRHVGEKPVGHKPDQRGRSTMFSDGTVRLRSSTARPVAGRRSPFRRSRQRSKPSDS